MSTRYLRLSLIALCITGLESSICRADTILFQDLSDNVAVVTTSTRVTGLTCETNALFESCVLTLLAPKGSVLVSGAPQTIFVAETPGPSFVSDEIAAGGAVSGNFVTLNFFSDVDSNPGSLGTCNTPPIITPCQIVERRFSSATA